MDRVTILSWLALVFYVLGVVLGLLGVRRALMANRAARRRLAFAKGRTGPFADVPAPTKGQVARSAMAFAQLLEDQAGDARRGTIYLLAALAVELVGNVLSLPWTGG